MVSVFKLYEYDLCPICGNQMEFIDKIYEFSNIQSQYDNCRLEVVAERYYCKECDKHYDIEIY